MSVFRDRGLNRVVDCREAGRDRDVEHDHARRHGLGWREFDRGRDRDQVVYLDLVGTVANVELEDRLGFRSLEGYSSFSENVKRVKRELLAFLITVKNEGKRICSYGAPGKGNTLLNYCGIRTDFVDYVVDRSPYKQGKFLPGVRIPIYPPEQIRETRPDYLLILPWNLKDEVIKTNAYIREWGGQFVVPIPEVRVYP